MKDRETQLAFIKARAEGKSFGTIAKELGIAKSTCTTWEQSFRSDITALKDAQMEELYTSYGMKRDARIAALGRVLQSIDEAMSERSLMDIPTEKLLELRLKYFRELKTEYRESLDVDADDTLDGILEQYNRIFRESIAGNYSAADVKAQLSILDAKRDVLCKIAQERDREEKDPTDLTLCMTQYTSRIIRHDPK